MKALLSEPLVNEFTFTKRIMSVERFLTVPLTFLELSKISGTLPVSHMGSYVNINTDKLTLISSLVMVVPYCLQPRS